MKENNLIVFNDGDFSLDVNVSPEEETVWLTKDQIALLFERDRTVISKHIKSIYKDGELKENSTCAKNAQVQVEGNRKIRRIFEYFNLDLVIAVGYRVNSLRGLKLKEYLKKYLDNSLHNHQHIIVYNNGDIKIDVNVSPQEKTVWLTQKQISDLFETTQQNVSLHINNIVEEGELDDSVHKESLYTASDGKNYLVDFYNLDMVLAVGYRVKTNRAIQFRKWVSDVLKKYLIKGYAVDEERIVMANNILSLQNDVHRIEQHVKELEEKNTAEPVKEKLFFDGEYFDAYMFICGIVEKAQKSVVVIDPYFDAKALVYLEKAKKEVDRTVYFCHESGLTLTEVNKFRNQYGMITLKKIKKFHDRFIIIDEKECYSIGTSLNHLGRQTFSVIKMEDSYFINILLDHVRISPKEKLF